ncbi:MAG: hypothetical protein L3J41_07075 [Melioribacteraceae bacterium]|nr:hypothetical protein [Melioribacteraceae bacterium]
MFIRFILYSLALYFLMKAAKIIIIYFKQVSNKEKPNVTQNRSSNNRVNKRDIIDADFEEISDDEKKE